MEEVRVILTISRLEDYMTFNSHLTENTPYLE